MLSHNTVHPIFKFNFGVRKLNLQLLESKLNENSSAAARTGLPNTNITKKSAVGNKLHNNRAYLFVFN